MYPEFDLILISVFGLCVLFSAVLRNRNFMPLGIFAIVIAYVLENFGRGLLPYSLFPLLLVLSFGLSYSFVLHKRYFFLLLAVIAALYFYEIFFITANLQLIAAFGIGGASGFLYAGKKAIHEKDMHRRKDYHIELKRDYFQLILAAIILLILEIAHDNASVYLIYGLELLGIFGAAVTSHNDAVSRFFRGMEKLDRHYEEGALFLAFGLSIIIGIFGYSPFAVFGAIILMVCDPAATIIGIKFGGRKLPYNANKSFAGTIAFFLVGAAFGVFLLGFYGIVISMVMAFIESVDAKIDDNIAIASVFSFIILLLS